jgi:hypothetical protein
MTGLLEVSTDVKVAFGINAGNIGIGILEGANPDIADGKIAFAVRAHRADQNAWRGFAWAKASPQFPVSER